MREHFEGILGVGNALDNTNDLLAYSYDASGVEGKARIVLFPKSTEHLRQILVYANRTNIAVVPRGLGGNPMGMVVPENAIVLDMKYFDRIHTLNLKEGWVKVDCGVVLGDLQRALLKHGLTFPINPESRNVATIGALLAMNQLDRRSHKNGRLKDYVLDLELIDGTGKHYAGGGKKEFLGMEGTGAIIISAKIKLLPVIEETSSDLLAFDDLIEVTSAVHELKDDLTVLSVEYTNPVLSEMLKLPRKHHLFVEYSGDKGAYVGEREENLWKKRMGSWDIATRNGYPIIEDCSGSIDHVQKIIEWCENDNLPVAAHIGLGIVHPFYSQDYVRDALYSYVSSIGANVTGQFGHGILKKKFVSELTKSTLIKLKDTYDYNNIVNRGKLYDYA